jgi:hypothetical protein
VASLTLARAGRYAPVELPRIPIATFECASRVPDPRANEGVVFADKAGIIVMAAGFAAIAYIWAVAVIAAGLWGADHLLAHELGFGLRCDLALAAPVWLTLRAIDLAKGGPWKRRRRT